MSSGVLLGFYGIWNFKMHNMCTCVRVHIKSKRIQNSSKKKIPEMKFFSQHCYKSNQKNNFPYQIKEINMNTLLYRIFKQRVIFYNSKVFFPPRQKHLKKQWQAKKPSSLCKNNEIEDKKIINMQPSSIFIKRKEKQKIDSSPRDQPDSQMSWNCHE